ncbi:hypothetical protein H0H93_007326 [Arthromyces matolae]|nr:hypothetical protein H0H93_007326 [Arthromyces matolae]
MLRTPIPSPTLPNSTPILPFSTYPATSSSSQDLPTTQDSSTSDGDRLNSRSRSVRVRDVSNSAKKAEKTLEKIFQDEECRRHYFDLLESIPRSACYLRKSLVPMVKYDLGPLFRDLLRKLIRREALGNFSTDYIRRSCPIFTEKRPPEITLWIRGGTGRCGAEVFVRNTVDFSKRWSVWWEDVQPRWDWRTPPEKPHEDSYPAKAEPLTDQDHKHWTSLRNSTGNILILLVAALHGWGLAVQKGSPQAEIKDESWLCAVNDCSLLMDLLIECAEKENGQELTGEGSRSISATA